jgi:hypothetical protein
MKKWIMLTVCSAIFFAANAQQTPAENPSQTTVKSEPQKARHNGKRFRHEKRNFRHNHQFNRRSDVKGKGRRAENLRHHMLRNHSGSRYAQNHFRHQHFNRHRYSHGG